MTTNDPCSWFVCALAMATVGCLMTTPSHAGDPPAAKPTVIQRQVSQVIGNTEELYRWFHANPELSGQEVETAKRMAQELRAIGLEVHEGIGGHGIVAILRSARDPRGPVVLYRADMDGLPVTEKTGLPYASKNQGVMHACGHDIHMAAALGTLRVLAAMNRQWRGTVLFVAQPAEEISAGSRDMLADPKFQRILQQVGKPKVAFALHNTPTPAGTVAVSEGYVMANVDSIDIVIHGRGGHGARPHQTIDPVVIGSEIVLSLQTIVSRRLPPGTRAVVTVGKFSAGTKHNIIAPQATLLLTVRSYTDDVRNTLLEEIRRVAENVAKAHNAPRPPTISVREHFTPSLYNDPAWSKRLQGAFSRVLGADNVGKQNPVMGGEDFARYARTLEIPGVMWRLGAVDPELLRTVSLDDVPGLHSDKWAPAPRVTLETAVTTATTAVLEGLR